LKPTEKDYKKMRKYANNTFDSFLNWSKIEDVRKQKTSNVILTKYKKFNKKKRPKTI
jgi:hypothetical protein